MNEKGYLEGRDMATTFNMLRANDLIWSFVVNNYLLGKDPFPFDLLYWNSDSTRMPAAMHSFYLRSMYQENKLTAGEITLLDTPIDLTRIKTPSFILSTREDHIAPWKSTFAATKLYRGPTRFVLAASGHIAGVVNPPAANKYGFWTNEKKAKTPEGWLEGATQHDGSWWAEWPALDHGFRRRPDHAPRSGSRSAQTHRGCAGQLRSYARLRLLAPSSFHRPAWVVRQPCRCPAPSLACIDCGRSRTEFEEVSRCPVSVLTATAWPSSAPPARSAPRWSAFSMIAAIR